MANTKFTPLFSYGGEQTDKNKTKCIRYSKMHTMTKKCQDNTEKDEQKWRMNYHVFRCTAPLDPPSSFV